MTTERCDQCGFDGDDWSDVDALAAVGELPGSLRYALRGIDADNLRRRPIAAMWSIAEYVDHVRETVFGMRFILDIALGESGTDLGEPPEPAFNPEPRHVDVDAALIGFEHGVLDLCNTLCRLPSDRWRASVTIGGEQVDARWIVRHALHDVSHHIGDIDRLRGALASP